jgi:probable phosphoglycerate mutase
MTAEMLLVRHGRTAWHDGNRYAGSSDIPLDDVGEQQAAVLARWAKSAELTHLVSSPMQRTVATANTVAAATGLQIELAPDLRELAFGMAEGRTMSEISASHPDVAAAFVADPAESHWPGGERPTDRARDAATALAEIASSRRGGRVLVVMHSTMIRLVICQLLGIPLARYRDVLGQPKPSHITTLVMTDNHAALVQYNAAPCDGGLA